MAKENSNILTAEQEMKLRQPIEDYVGKDSEKSRQVESRRYR